MTCPLACRHVLTLGLLALTTASQAQEPPRRVARLFTAGELPGLAERGVRLPREGTYTVKVWAPANQTWTLSVEGPALSLRPRLDGDDDAPRWQTVGEARLPAGKPVTVRVV